MTDEIGADPWSTLDELLGVEVADPVDEGIGPLAFYGRCSTEDNQHPETSHGWQLGNAQKFVEPLGGKFDTRNPSHKMLMSVLGGMSESERQHVQARVRAAMDAQVLNEGRHQGGRAPYGYAVVDGGLHPNPRKAAEGYRLRVLGIDEDSAEVVRRIFAEYLDGKG